MGATTKGLRYPEATDLVTQGATAIRNLATDVDGKLPALTTSTGATASAGWTISDQALQRVPLATGAVLVSINLLAVRATGQATLTPTAAGNIAPDTPMVTLPTGYRPPVVWAVSMQVYANAPATGQIDTTGVISIMEQAPGGTVAAGVGVRVVATYLVAA